MADKKSLLKDLRVVTETSSKNDMSIPANAQRLRNSYAKYYKSYFKTEIGNLYLERLNQISSGTAPAECFVCKKVKAYDSVLCESCMQRFAGNGVTFYTKKHGKNNNTPKTFANDNAFEELFEDNSNQKSKSNSAMGGFVALIAFVILAIFSYKIISGLFITSRSECIKSAEAVAKKIVVQHVGPGVTLNTRSKNIAESKYEYIIATEVTSSYNGSDELFEGVYVSGVWKSSGDVDRTADMAATYDTVDNSETVDYIMTAWGLY